MQRPHPPIWVGGRSQPALVRAGRLGDGWLAYFVTPEGSGRRLARAHAHWEPREGRPFGAGVVLYANVASTREEAGGAAGWSREREYRQPFDEQVDRYLNYCDARAIMLGIHHGRERIAVDEIADRQYRILHLEPGRVAALPEFFHLWGEPLHGGRSHHGPRAHQSVVEELGDIKYAGIVGLGALIQATGVVSFDAVVRCLEQTRPSYRHHMIPANERALRRGADCAVAAMSAARP